jgi:hypothetical protein
LSLAKRAGAVPREKVHEGYSAWLGLAWLGLACCPAAEVLAGCVLLGIPVPLLAGSAFGAFVKGTLSLASRAGAVPRD